MMKNDKAMNKNEKNEKKHDKKIKNEKKTRGKL